MTVHARSDVSAVTISPEGGGCGELHSRPVHQGAPVKLWSLTCNNGCEDILRKDSHWSGTISGIPETPDEEEYRKDQETKGRLDQQNQTAEALAKLGSLGDLPAAIAQLATMFSGEPKRERESSSVKSCSNCNASWSADVKFCPECGTRASGNGGPSAVGSHIDVSGLNYQQLKDLAVERGIQNPHSMKKTDLVNVLSGQ